MVNNDNELQKVKHVHLKNLKALIPNISWEFITKKKHDPKQVIHNYSSHQLSSHKENILSKGLNFAIPSKHLIHDGYVLPFELLYWETFDLHVSHDDREFIKGRIKDICFSSRRAYNDNASKELKFLKKNQRLLKSLLRWKALLSKKLTKEILLLWLF